jgi:hypothetical protein
VLEVLKVTVERPAYSTRQEGKITAKDKLAT